MYGKLRTVVKGGGLLLLLISATASRALAQTPALLEAVRVQAPNLAGRAQAELAACEAERGSGRRATSCAARARLSLLTGVLLLSEGEPKRAADQLAAVKPPRQLEAFHGWYLGEAQAWSGARAQALKTLLRIGRKAPASLARRIELRIAELQLELGQAQRARPVLEKYASETPTPDALLSRASARIATGATLQAHADLRTIVLRFPTHPHSIEAMRLLSRGTPPVFSFEEQLQRAQALVAQGAPSDALAQLDSTSPPEQSDAARVALVRAQALLAKGQEADAFAQLDLAISSGAPGIAAEALMTRARRLMRAQDHEQARALMLSLEAKYPDNGNAEDAAYLGAWMSLADGKYQRAVADFDAFESRHPESRKRDEAKWFRAWALFRLGRFSEARGALRGLVDDFPRSSLVPQARYWSTRLVQLSAARNGQASSPDAGAMDVAAEYEQLVSAFPGTLYSVLAAERLRELGRSPPRVFVEAPRSLPVKPVSSLALAVELAQAGLLRDAADEINRVVGTVTGPDAALEMGHALQALGEFGPAHGLAARWLWGPAYSARKPEALQLMYPRAFREAVESHSQEVGLSPYLAWAIMRRESGFRPEVASAADARGLMQIIPPTAREIARSIKEPAPSPEDLFGPALNVRYGTWYLAALHERMGHPALCAAAYNAGPAAVSRWTTQRGALPLDEFIEEIPYKETRNYVKQVLADFVVYQQLYGVTEARVSLTLSSPRATGVAF